MTLNIPTDVNLFDVETQRCPYDAYKTLRDEAPVYQCPATGMYVITRFDDVRQILTDTEHFTNETAYLTDATEPSPRALAVRRYLLHAILSPTPLSRARKIWAAVNTGLGLVMMVAGFGAALADLLGTKDKGLFDGQCSLSYAYAPESPRDPCNISGINLSWV